MYGQLAGTGRTGRRPGQSGRHRPSAGPGSRQRHDPRPKPEAAHRQLRPALPKHAADHRQPSTTRRHAALVAVTHTLIESPRCAATQLRGIIRLDACRGPRDLVGGRRTAGTRLGQSGVHRGRFGLRGLATEVFALLAVEAGDDDTLSHGDLDAGDDRAAQCDPARADRRRVARRYDGWVERERPVIETAPATEPRARRPMVPRWQNDV